MRYTNSEKISDSYLDKEKARILGFLNGKDYPFMECYRQKLESISEEQDNYRALRRYIALYDELSAFFESEEYDLKLARYYRSHEKSVTPVTFIIEDYFFKNLFVKYPIPEVGCLTELQMWMQDYFCEHEYRKNFTLSYWWWEEFANRDALIGPFLRAVMKIPDKQLLEYVFAFLESCSVTTEEINATWNGLSFMSWANEEWKALGIRFSKATIEKVQMDGLITVPMGLRAFMYEKNKGLLNKYSIQYILLSCIPHFTLTRLKIFDSIYGKVSLKSKSTYRYVSVIISLLIEWYETDSKWYKIMAKERNKVPLSGRISR